MCTLILYLHIVPQYPIVVAANRDESLDRASSSPIQLTTLPRSWGGQDLRAGGTWLGVNEYGVLAGILNGHSAAPADTDPRSRGLLCLDALSYPSATAAAEFVMVQQASAYNPFHLLISDATAAYVITAHDRVFTKEVLPPGIHVLSNWGLNDPACPRTAYIARHLAAPHQKCITTSAGVLLKELRILLADHEAPRDPYRGLCIHGDGYGTSSSTLLAYGKSQERYVYHFAPGPPCQTPYNEIPLPPAVALHPPSI
jgi:uncharacterized protein with NRDE domain